MNHAICGIGRCRDFPDLDIWHVPICTKHWTTLCKEAPGSSLEWLRRHVRKEFREVLPERAIRAASPTRRVAHPTN